MVHGDISMFEGGAMCSYFIDQFDVERKLLPRDPDAVAKYYLFNAWCASTLDNLIAMTSPLQIALPLGTAPPAGSEELHRKYFLEQAAPYVTKELRRSGGDFICGQCFTAADIVLGFLLIFAKRRFGWISSEATPELDAYVEILAARPAFQRATAPIDAAAAVQSLVRE